MSRLLGAACLGIAASAAFAAAVANGNVERTPVRQAHKAVADATRNGRVIVKFRERTTALSAATAGGARLGPKAASLLAARLNVALVDGRAIGPRTQVIKAPSLGSEALAALLARQADVEWAEVDHRRFPLAAPNDPLYADNQLTTTPAAGQWYLRPPTLATVSGVDIETAWNVTHGLPATATTPIVIADLDTGVTSHPDLVNKLLPGYDFVGYSSDDGADALATANDGNLADSDPSDPGDWVTAAENSQSGGAFFGCNDGGAGGSVGADSSWHGTQTAGVLAAQTNNGVGMAGTAYDTMIVPVRVLGKCGGFDSDIAAGMLWAGGIAVSGVPANAHPARVLNMSLGGTGSCVSVYVDAMTQLTARNVVVVAAAGNEFGADVDTPANCPGVIAVAAVRSAGDKNNFSNLGPAATIAAPGGNCGSLPDGSCQYPILSTANTGLTTPVAATYTTGGDNAGVGTSFATPIVAGTVALMLSTNPSLTNSQVVSFLRTSATPFPTTGGLNGGSEPVCTAPSSAEQDYCYCTTTTCGAGMLNAGLAVQRAAGATGGSAVISVPTTAAVGDTVTLDSAGSAASAGAVITGYAWSITDGAGRVTITGDAVSPTFALATTGTGVVTAKLVTTDSAGKTGVAFRTFTIATSDPVAAITGGTTVAVGSTLSLSGTSSTATGSRSLASYAWQIVSGSSSASLGSTTGTTTTLTGLAAGTVTVQLTVTDNTGATNATTSTITVNTASSGGGSSSGGGGAANPLWLLGLLAAGLALAPRRRRG